MMTKVWCDIDGYHIKIVYPVVRYSRSKEKVYVHTFSEGEFEDLLLEMVKVSKPMVLPQPMKELDEIHGNH